MRRFLNRSRPRRVPKNRLLSYLVGERLRISIVLSANLMGTALWLAGPWIWGILLVDKVILGSDTRMLPMPSAFC